MTLENEYWTQFLAGSVLLLAIYPIAKDALINPLNTIEILLGSVFVAVVAVYIGDWLRKRQSR